MARAIPTSRGTRALPVPGEVFLLPPWQHRLGQSRAVFIDWNGGIHTVLTTSAGIREAVRYARANAGGFGCQVRLGEGEYVGTVLLDSAQLVEGVSITGQGWSTVLRGETPGQPVLKVDGRFGKFVLKDMKITSGGDTGTHAIHLNLPFEWRLENISVEARNLSSQIGGIGILLEGVSDGQVINCDIGASCLEGLKIWKSRLVSVVACNIHENFGPGLHITASTHCTVTGNKIYSNNGHGMQVIDNEGSFNDGDGFAITANIVRDSGAALGDRPAANFAGLFLRTTKVSIEGNTFEKNHSAGMLARNVNHSSFIGNISRGNGIGTGIVKDGLRCISDSFGTFTHNTIQDNSLVGNLGFGLFFETVTGTLNGNTVQGNALDGNTSGPLSLLDGACVHVSGNTARIRITQPRLITNAQSPYIVTSDDEIILVDTNGGVVTVTLPANPIEGRRLVIKDSGGNAAVNNITVSLNGTTYDGSAVNPVINTAYGIIRIIADATNYFSL